MKKYNYGNKVKLSIYGSSHGEYVGALIRGLPEGKRINIQKLKEFMARRAPKGKLYSTQRKEDDEFVILKGIEDDTLTGSDLEVIIPNKDVKKSDYSALAGIPRPGHADFGAYLKYGVNYDMSGGGPFSARLTAPLCFAGGICLQLLEEYGCFVAAHILSVGGCSDKRFDTKAPEISNLPRQFPVIDDTQGEAMKKAIEEAAKVGDSLGCVIECAAVGFPRGVGGALFEGIEGKIAEMLFAVPAVKGVDFGAGFAVGALKGSENNDPFHYENGHVEARTNNSGGILGGISIGSPIICSAAFKPPSSIAATQQSVDLIKHENKNIAITGRHDPCIAQRAVPIVEAGVGFALYDMLRGHEGNIYLSGMPGCGKTTIGKALSEKTGLPFYDTDELVRLETGMDIPAIFEEYGEVYFRLMEKHAISRVTKETKSIVALGGGTLMDEATRMLIKNTGLCVYLKRNIDSLSSQGRPLSSSKEKIKELYEKRSPVYELMSDIVVDNNGSLDDCVKELAQELDLRFIDE